jgi:hypothetical protein
MLPHLVNGVVEDLVQQVVEAPLARTADVHPRPLAHRLEPIQDLVAAERGFGFAV